MFYLRALPSNGRCLQSQCLGTDLYAILCYTSDTWQRELYSWCLATKDSRVCDVRGGYLYALSQRPEKNERSVILCCILGRDGSGRVLCCILVTREKWQQGIAMLLPRNHTSVSVIFCFLTLERPERTESRNLSWRILVNTETWESHIL
jgi:hypothetical protein